MVSSSFFLLLSLPAEGLVLPGVLLRPEKDAFFTVGGVATAAAVLEELAPEGGGTGD